MHILYTARLEEIHSENLSIWNFPTESNLLDSISIRNSVPLRLLQWLITSPHHPIRFPDERWVAAKGKGKNDEVRRSWSQELDYGVRRRRTEELASWDTTSTLWKPTYEFVLQMCQGHTDPTVRSLPEDTELDLWVHFQLLTTTIQ